MPEGAIDHILAERAPAKRQRIIRGVWLVFAIAMALQSQKGADYWRYSLWAKAFASANILKLQSSVLSPVGVPVTQWSHAPGLITDAIARTLSVLPSVTIDMHTAAWLSAIVFWWAMIGLVGLATGGNPVLFMWALAVAFIGTHIGFYSLFHSSEIFALSTFAVASFWALSAAPGRLRDSLLVGVACGLLLISRVNLAMYVGLPLAARAFIVWRGQGNRLNKALVLHALVLGAPLLVYGVQLLFFNYWATGSPSHSPYVYGEGGFRSVDLAHPQLGTMLFHSWHGLLTYHPLFALGPIALVALLLRRDLPLPERLLAGYALFALLAHVYVQAGWWCWWNGTGSYGNRSFTIGGVVVVVALARWLFLLEQSATRKGLRSALIVLSVSAACSFWSFLLYLQGHSNYVAWRDLLNEQRIALLDPNGYVPACVASVMSLGFGIALFRRLRRRAVVVAITAFVATLAVHGLLGALVRNWSAGHGVERFAPALTALVSVTSFALTIYLATDRNAPQILTRYARSFVAGGLLCVFVMGTWSFSELALATKHVI
ncbi:MAG TPA: hypothetical protein VGC79_10260, partial [Polyangiaceae bacterium]